MRRLPPRRRDGTFKSRRPRGNPAPRAWKGRSGTFYHCPGQKYVPKSGLTYRGSKWKVTGCATPRRGKPGVGQYWIQRGAQGGGKGHAVPKSAVRSAIYRNKLRNKGRLALCPQWKTDVGFPHKPGGAKGCAFRKGAAGGPKTRGVSKPRKGVGYAWATRPPSRSTPWHREGPAPSGLVVVENPIRRGKRFAIVLAKVKQGRTRWEQDKPVAAMWLNVGTLADAAKARTYAAREGYKVFLYPTTVQDPLGRAKREVAARQNPRRRRRSR